MIGVLIAVFSLLNKFTLDHVFSILRALRTFFSCKFVKWTWCDWRREKSTFDLIVCSAAMFEHSGSEQERNMLQKASNVYRVRGEWGGWKERAKHRQRLSRSIFSEIKIRSHPLKSTLAPFAGEMLSTVRSINCTWRTNLSPCGSAWMAARQ